MIHKLYNSLPLENQTENMRAQFFTDFKGTFFLNAYVNI